MGSCTDGSDLYRPIIQKPTKTEEQEEKGHISDGEQRTNEDNAKVAKEKPTTTINKRDLAEIASNQQTQQMWKSGPETRDPKTSKPSREAEKYIKDISTGLWMVAVSKETCEVSGGFVCKVRLGVMGKKT